jgi:hypothetical protein
MADTTFINGTVVQPSWLNEINDRVYGDVFNVMNAPYGAVGDGVTDDQPAITAAITAAIASGRPATVYFPTRTYKCNAILGTFTGSNITLDFNGSTLDFSSIALATTSTLLFFTGSYSTGVNLTSNAAENQSTVNCVSTGFAVGDLVRIYSNEVFDPTRTATRIGEINYIETIPGGTSVTTTTPLQMTYNTADSAKIEKLTPITNVVIKNGTFIGPAGNDEIRGWRFRVAVNCRAEGMRSYDIDYLHAQLTDCIHCTVSNCYFEESNNAATAYGVSFADASQDCLAYGNHFVNVRHSLSTNNNVSSSWGITRRIRFELNSVRDSAKATGGTGGDAIDTHAGAEDISIINNTVQSSSGIGINVEARSAVVSGNWVKHSTSVGIYFYPHSTRVPNVSITNNRCEAIGDGTGLDPGILVAVGDVAPSRVTIVGNFVESSTSEGIRVTGTSGSTLRYLTLTGNTIRTSSTGQALYVRQADRAVISGNTILGTAANTGVLLEDVNFLSMGSNVVEIQGTDTNGYLVRLTGTGTRNGIVGNTLYNNGTFTNSYGVHFADTITASAVHCNTFPGVTTDVTLGAGAGNVQSNNA